MKLTRIDRGSEIHITTDAAELPTPAYAPAVRTPEGYLIVDAYLARDGLLKYSDGESDWWEYRPRVELERAASSWYLSPVTDDHPEQMVDSETYREVARGIVMTQPTMETAADGTTYMRAKLRITDSELVSKIEGGKHELSIGFRAHVAPTVDGVASDGTRADAVQTGLDGNHVSAVDRGRAGPAVRVFLDGAAVPSSRVGNMKNQKPSPSGTANKKDQEGAPTELVSIVGPDGQEIQVPTWIAAKLQQAEAMMQQPAAPAPAPAPAAPMPPRQEAVGEETEEPTKDSVATMVRRRASLERLAGRVGIGDAEIDAADDDTLARAYVTKVMPEVKLDGLTREQLDAVVHVARQMPAAQPEAAAPRNDGVPLWAAPIPVPAGGAQPPARTDAENAYLKRKGFIQ